MNKFAFIIIRIFELVYHDILVDAMLYGRSLPEMVFEVYRKCATATRSSPMDAGCKTVQVVVKWQIIFY